MTSHAKDPLDPSESSGGALAGTAEQARHVATAAVAAQKALGKGDLQAAIEKLAAAKQALALLVSDSERWTALSGDWAATLERRHLELEADFRRDCQALGWRVDGHWPELYIERAIGVRFDEKTRSAAVGGRTLSQVDSRELVAMLRPLVQELLPKKFSPADFVQSLCEAYDEVRGSKTQVGILSVYRSFVLQLQRPRFWRDARQQAFVGLSLDQFRSRLTNALEAGAVQARDGRELRLIPPLDASEAIFVYQPAERRFGYVGRIEFSPI